MTLANKRMRIKDGLVVLPDSVVSADILIVDGRIARIDEPSAPVVLREQASDGVLEVDASGAWVLPGLVDIHCDTIEKEAEPRPNTLFPLDMAFLNFERKLAGHGITTMLHSLSLGIGLSLRGEHLVEEMIRRIVAHREQRAMIRHGIHLRYEVSHLTGMQLAARLIEEGLLDYISLMDHAPGQGQYRKPGAFERYVMKNQGVNVEEVAVIVDDLQSRRSQVDWTKLREMTAHARSKGIAIASHDDDSVDAVQHSMSYGAHVSEFPLNLETARYAKSQGLGVCVGAPNVVRGGSHDGNLRAIDAIKAGAADILCSDYHPASLLHAVFALEEEGVQLHEAVSLATLRPAAAVGKGDQLGSIEPGKYADLIIVRQVGGVPLVERTITGGSVVYAAQDYMNRVL